MDDVHKQSQSMTRRRALKDGATAIGAVAVSRSLAVAQDSPIQVAGRPVEIVLTSISPQTVRVTIQPLENGRVPPAVPDGALVREDFEDPVQRVRNLRGRVSFQCGELQ